MLSLIRDVTERTRIEVDRAESNAEYFRFLADMIPQIVWIARADGSVEYWNRRWHEYAGLTEAEAFAPRRWGELLHPDDRERARVAWSRSLASGEPYEIEYRLRRGSDGAYRWHLVRATALPDRTGAVVKWFGTCTDIDDQKRAEQRGAFFAEASKALAASKLDLQRTLDTIVRLPLGRLADWCRIDLVADDGRLITAAVAHVDPAKEAMLGDFVGRSWIDPEGPTGVPKAFRSGRSVLLERIEQWMIDADTLAGRDREVFTAVGLRSGMAIPLLAHGRTLGVLSLISTESDRRYDRSDLEVAEELARRAALALDNARLYEREHRVATTLQRAMLPTVLPSPPGLAFGAAYVPSASEPDVGGDWYDVFALPDGRVALSIGDVAGHGLEAAVVMGEVRQSLRAVALGQRSPSRVLADADRLLSLNDRGSIVTAVFGHIDPDSLVFSYATAGHPAPIVALPPDPITGRRAIDVLPSDGVPLGVDGAAIELSGEMVITLAPGSLLVLYTDGIVEHERDVLAGEAALHRAIAALPASVSGTAARRIREAILGDRLFPDDVAILTLAVAERRPDASAPDRVASTPAGAGSPPPTPRVRRWSLRSRDTSAARHVRHEFVRFIRRCAGDRASIAEAELIAGELLANAVEHAAPGLVHAGVDWTGTEAVFRVSAGGGDERLARAIEAARSTVPDRLGERGRGLYLISRLARSLAVETDPERGEPSVVARIPVGPA